MRRNVGAILHSCTTASPISRVRCGVKSQNSKSGRMKNYKRVLSSLMSSVHRLEVGQDYAAEREYTDDEKRQVTPEEMV
jgi:hypothetical protein